IANLGMSGNGPVRQLARLEHDGLRLDPDVIVMMTESIQFSAALLLEDSVAPGYALADDGTVMRGYAFRDRFASRLAGTTLGRAFVAAYQHIDLFRAAY